MTAFLRSWMIACLLLTLAIDYQRSSAGIGQPSHDVTNEITTLERHLYYYYC